MRLLSKKFVGCLCYFFVRHFEHSLDGVMQLWWWRWNDRTSSRQVDLTYICSIDNAYAVPLGFVFVPDGTNGGRSSQLVRTLASQFLILRLCRFLLGCQGSINNLIKIETAYERRFINTWRSGD
jgi:hypothetical protein